MAVLVGDVVKPNVKIEEEGISIPNGHGESHHPYRQLFVYNFGRKISYQLTDADAARSYFTKFNPTYNNGCPEGREGIGVTIFSKI